MPRRTAEAAARTRAALIASAAGQFGTLGFGATSTAAIAAEAKCSQSALFHHFPDKVSLFEAVVGEMVAAYDAEVRRSAQAESTPRAMMLAGCRRSLELARDPAWVRIVSTDGLAVLGEDRFRRLDAAFGMASTLAGLRALVELGDLAADTDVEALAVVIYGGLTEAAFAAGRGGEAAGPDRVMAVIARLLDAHAPSTAG